jgi:hypothetical protein
MSVGHCLWGTFEVIYVDLIRGFNSRQHRFGFYLYTVYTWLSAYGLTALLLEPLDYWL